jgi:hypothetical protein
MSLKRHLISIIAPTLVNSLISSAPPSQVKKTIDAWLDHLEEYVVETPNKFDDNLIYFFKWLRQIIDIPDEDDKVEKKS